MDNLDVKIAIIILNYNGLELLKKFLPSVLAYSNSYQIIIIDNASTDSSINFIKTNYPTIKIIVNNKNYGFAGGYNEGIKNINAKYYILLNSDVEVSPQWVEPLINFMEKYPQVVATQPKLLSYNNKKLFEYAGASGGFIDLLAYPFCRGRVIEKVEQDMQQYDNAIRVFWVSGAALCIRSDIYHKLKGFDTYFFAHQEEIDLCWRIQRIGYQCYVVPQSVVYHLGAGTLSKQNLYKVYLNHRNSLIMVSKNLPFLSTLIVVTTKILIEQFASAYLQALRGNFKMWVCINKAHLHYFKWLFFATKQFNKFPKVSLLKLTGVIPKFLIFEYFICKKKTYISITKK